MKSTNHLTAAQRRELEAMLRQKWQELTTQLKENRAAVAAQQSVGDEADQATEDARVSLGTRLIDRNAKLLREVERALDKIKDNTYGLCEGTDEPIGYARLKLRPWTRYSVTYKEELERETDRSMSPG
ncbi:MAG: TraR/DksA family transcriptional regulator [Myxococcota bacterium]